MRQGVAEGMGTMRNNRKHGKTHWKWENHGKPNFSKMKILMNFDDCLVSGTDYVCVRWRVQVYKVTTFER